MSTVNDTDLLLVERNGVKYQITYDEMSTLNDDDLLLVERNGVQYKVEAQHIGTAANGVILPEVEVLTPLDRAGDPELTYLKSDTILAVEDDGGSRTHETDAISAVTADRWVDNGSVTWAATAGDAEDPTAEDVNKIFDDSWSHTFGDQDFFLIRGTTPGTDHLVTLTFNPPITYNSKVEVLHEKSFIDGGQMLSHRAGINGNVSSNTTSGDRLQWIELVSGSGVMETLTFGGKWPYAARNYQSIRAIRVDGVVLTNTNVLSFPTSNNFDKFAVGDVADNSMKSPMFALAYLASEGLNTANWKLGGFIDVDPTELSTQEPGYFQLPSEYSYFMGFYIDGTDLALQMAGSGWQTYSSVDGVNWVAHETFTGSINVSAHAASNPGARYFALGPIGGQSSPHNLADLTFSSSTFFTPFEIEIPVNDELFPRSLITAIDADATPDPTITVGGGEWLDPSSQDVSQEWSSFGTGTPYNSNYGWDKAFNGVIATGTDEAAFAGTSQTITWTPTTPITVNSEVTLYLYMDAGLAINGSYISPDNTPTGGSYGEAHIYSAAKVGGYLTSISISTTSSSVGPFLTGVAVDGKLLIDASVPVAGDDKISKSITYDTKLVLEGDTDLAQMSLGPAVMTDGVLGGSGYSQTPYTLTTSTIETVTAVPEDGFYQDFLSAITFPNKQNPQLMFNGDDTDVGFWFYGSGSITFNSQYVFPIPIEVLAGQTLRVKAVVGDQNNYMTVNTSIGAVFGTWFNAGTVDESYVATQDFTVQNFNLRQDNRNSSTGVLGLYVIEVDGKPALQSNGPRYTLEFPGDVSTNPDLRYFEAGDVCQSLGVQYETSEPPQEVTADPFAADGGLIRVNAGASASIKFIYPEPVNFSGIRSWRGGSYSQAQPFTITWEDENGATSTTSGTTTTSYVSQALSSNPPNLVKAFTITGSDGYAFLGWGDASYAFVPTGELGTTVVSVISTDLAANTMTVDGGAWGVYDNSQVWSDFGTGINYGTRTWSKAFDGVISDSPNGHAFPAAGQTMTWTPTTPITVNDSVILYGVNDTDSATYGIKLNGSSSFLLPTTSGYGDPISVPAANIGGTLSKIELVVNGSSYGPYLTAVSVDGKLLIDAGTNGLGATKALTILPGGTGDLVEIDAANNAVYLTAGDRAWIPSNNFNGETFALAAGSLANPSAPDYLDIAFTSMNAGTTPFSGVDATLSSRTWTLETAPDKSGPWTVVNTYEDFDMTASQDGATPWTTGKPVLNQSTWYRVKVTYNSTAAESVESDYHTFKTGV